MSKKKIKVLRFSVPKNEAVFREDDYGRKTINIHVPMEQFVQQEYDEDVNVREHPESLLRKRIPKNIASSVLNDPEDFHLKNGGVCILAEDVTYEGGKNGEVVVTLTKFTGSHALHGVIDGFTTTAVVKHTVKNSLNSDNPVDFSDSYVPVEIIAGVNSRPEMAAIAAARSQGISVTDTTIANWDHEFDTLKAVMGDSEGVVGWAQNDTHKDPDDGKEYSYLFNPNQLIGRIYVFHPNHGVMTSEGRTAFKSCLAASTNSGKMTEKYLHPEFRDGWEALLPLVPEILELWDYVEHKFYEMYIDYGKEFGPVAPIFSLKNGPGNFVFWVQSPQTKATRGVRAKKLIKSEVRELHFSNYTSEMPHIHDAFLYPFLSGLRALLIQDDDGTLRWSKDPKRFINKNGKYLMETLFGLMDNIQYDLTLMGKTAKFWKKMHVEVEKLLK